MNCLTVFDHFVGLAVKGLSQWKIVDPDNIFCRQSNPFRANIPIYLIQTFACYTFNPNICLL